MQDQINKAIQTRLLDLGWYTGSVDGSLGPASENALIDFKKSIGFQPRPVFGVDTLSRLFAADANKRPAAISTNDRPSWLVEAYRLEGLRETKGATSNPRILDMALNVGIDYKSDDVAWCGLFVAHCVHVGAPLELLPKNALSARAWENFGKKVKPQIGAIMVFWRGSREGWQGHVAFYVGEDKDHYYVIGGNQSDSVSVMKMLKPRLLQARYPSGFEPKGLTATMSGGKLSTNEA